MVHIPRPFPIREGGGSRFTSILFVQHAGFAPCPVATSGDGACLPTDNDPPLKMAMGVLTSDPGMKKLVC